MGNKLTVDQDTLDDFWRFVCERQDIWHRRFVLKELPPWTEDEILSKYKFTNVYRELDKGTLFIVDNIINHLGAYNHDILFNILIYRLFNKEDTFLTMGFQEVETFDADEVVKVLEAYQDLGNKLWSPAYMVTGRRFADFDDKLRNIIIGVVQNDIIENWDDIWETVQTGSMKEVWQRFTEIACFKGFMGYECVIDINYSDIVDFNENDFVNPGPGCKRGISYIVGDHDIIAGKGKGVGKWTNGQFVKFIKYLRRTQDKHFDRLGLNFKQYNGRPLTDRNIEHSLCEYNKYWRIQFDPKYKHLRKFEARSDSYLYDDLLEDD
jgi:hypothetical protein